MAIASINSIVRGEFKETRSRLAERYETLFRVSRAISAHRDPQALFAALAGELSQAVTFDFIGIAQNDESTGQATWVLSQCRNECGECEPGCEQDGAMARWVHQHQKPLVIPFMDEETRFPGKTRELLQHGIQSLCALPLTTVHRRLGVLALGSRVPDAYSGEEVNFLGLVASQVAVALDDALHLKASKQAQAELRTKQDELQQERDRLKLLLEVNNSLVSNLELRDLLRAVSASVRRLMRCDVVSVALPLEGDRERLQIFAQDFPDGRGILREDLQLPVEGTLPGRAFQTGKPTLAGDLDSVPMNRQNCLTAAVNEGLKAGCFLPLIGRGGVLGVLCLGRRQGNAFQQEEIDFLTQVAGQAAIALDNAFAYGEIAGLKDRLAQEKLYLEDEIRSEMNFDEIVGTSRVLRRLLHQVETVAPTESAVLILGETGTGKELVARAIHNLSRRRERTFVKLNCAAIPTGLLESELFGHEKGAFTGAIAQRIGRFELAHNGTAFLDEIGEIPLELQPKLLRVLQEREFERLGSSRTLHTDARVVAASNRDLESMVEGQTFRSDLFYRLNVFPIRVPPLRERREDIPLLVRHFASQFARRNNKSIETIPSESMSALVGYHWPGNVRELQNVIERAVILSPGPVLKVPLADLKAGDSKSNGGVAGSRKQDRLVEVERNHILSVLEETNWIVSGAQGAAARLGMKRSTLQFRMKKLGIARPQ